MDLIYSGACSVRICVHDPYPSDYDILFHSLRGTADSNNEHLPESLSRSIQTLISLRYFSRAWVIQEVALARAAYLLVNHQELFLTSTAMDRLTSLCDRFNGVVPSVLRWHPGRQLKVDIITCLQAGIRCNVTDPRDRVFAVLSLMDAQARSLISADYSLDQNSVYTNAIVAIIITQQNLAILYHGGIGYASRSEDWRTRPCFEFQHFQNYLDSRGSDIQFQGESAGPWQSIINVDVVQPSDYHNEVRHQANASCIITRPQPVRLDLLPRLRVRAHYIDRVEQTTLRPKPTGGGVGDNLEPYITGSSPRRVYSSRAEFFRASVPLPDAPPQASNVILVNDREVNATDLMTFSKACWGQEVFSSYFSVGFSGAVFEKGDEIFAIDSVRKPLILRQTGAQSYRVVGVCYLWAALELDCWNPGTKKGRWGPNVKRPTEKQTRMIEIH
jgi:hypothetical protein